MKIDKSDIENNQLRIVLTWGSTPRDLDSHLSISLANSGAIVSVYSGHLTVPIRIYYVPTGQGVNWNVFSYDSKTCKITTINTLN